ncbi:hypothetical protein C0993_001364 [Termitomyces sp. T159_Od127]|nr:hypothetical protein C0993_001364 [Termitomyces sp. T159_Od127]
MALSPDILSAHLPSQSSQALLLYTTLSSSSTTVNTLVDSGTTDNFIDESLVTLAAMPQRLPLPICLTLFDGSSTSASNITHYVQTTLTSANSQQQDLQLLVIHLHAFAPLILGLPWLRSTNPHIDYFSATPLEICLVIHPQHPWRVSPSPHHPHRQRGYWNVYLQLFDDKLTTAGPITKTHSSSIVLDNGLQFLMTPDTNNADQPPNSLDLDALNIKIISPAPFTRIIQDGTPAFQLHISLALPEEHLGADATTLEPKTEKQILHKVVSPECHEFTDMFFKGSAKELPPHQSYDYKIDLKDGTAPYLARSTTC